MGTLNIASLQALVSVSQSRAGEEQGPFSGCFGLKRDSSGLATKGATCCSGTPFIHPRRSHPATTRSSALQAAIPPLQMGGGEGGGGAQAPYID